MFFQLHTINNTDTTVHWRRKRGGRGPPKPDYLIQIEIRIKVLPHI